MSLNSRVRPVTQVLFDAMLFDIWPDSSAAIVDFGLDSQEHYEALHGPIRAGEVSIEQLDDALGSGPKLTSLVRASSSNPHRDIVFRCAADGL